jgi:hypothetical protein
MSPHITAGLILSVQNLTVKGGFEPAVILIWRSAPMCVVGVEFGIGKMSNKVELNGATSINVSL